jgi:hypothetical protein
MTIDSPPIELIEEWRHEPEFAEPGLTTIYTMSEKQLKHIATKAAQWGADQELKVMRKPSMSGPPIIPPPELVKQWMNIAPINHPVLYVATKAAQWGFNQHQPVTDAQLQEVRDEELEACAEWAANNCPLGTAKNLRAARRSKPPSLKEEGLELLERIRKGETVWNLNELEIFDRILEALPND